MVRAPFPVIRDFGKSMYELLFKYEQVYHRQEIIGSIIAHIGSGIISFHIFFFFLIFIYSLFIIIFYCYPLTLF